MNYVFSVCIWFAKTEPNLLPESIQVDLGAIHNIARPTVPNLLDPVFLVY